MPTGGNQERADDGADAEWQRLVDATWSTPEDRRHLDELVQVAERPSRTRRHRRQPSEPGSTKAFWIVLVVLPLLLGAKAAAPHVTGWWDYLANGDPTFRVGAGAPAAPPSGGRVRPAVPVPDPPSASDYGFLRTQPSGDPVTFDPCEPIHYVIHDPVGLGDLGRDAVLRAANELSLATGLAFVFDGYTDEAPSIDRALAVQQYSTRWAPVLIAWSDPEKTPRLAGQVIGLGLGRSAQGADGQDTYVTGQVWLDTPSLGPDLDTYRGFAKAQSVVMHELGHVIGADHAASSGQLMSEAGNADTELGDGDRYVFARLGQGSCASGL